MKKGGRGGSRGASRVHAAAVCERGYSPLATRHCLLSGDRGLCARWRGTREGLLNDLPTAVWLASEDDYVAAFGGDFSSGGDCGQGFLEVAAVVGQIAG